MTYLNPTLVSWFASKRVAHWQPRSRQTSRMGVCILTPQFTRRSRMTILELGTGHPGLHPSALCTSQITKRSQEVLCFQWMGHRQGKRGVTVWAGSYELGPLESRKTQIAYWPILPELRLLQARC